MGRRKNRTIPCGIYQAPSGPPSLPCAWLRPPAGRPRAPRHGAGAAAVATSSAAGAGLRPDGNSRDLHVFPFRGEMIPRTRCHHGIWARHHAAQLGDGRKNERASCNSSASRALRRDTALTSPSACEDQNRRAKESSKNRCAVFAGLCPQRGPVSGPHQCRRVHVESDLAKPAARPGVEHPLGAAEKKNSLPFSTELLHILVTQSFRESSLRRASSTWRFQLYLDQHRLAETNWEQDGDVGCDFEPAYRLAE